MKTAVVIGANGFLGSALVKKLISENQKVIAVYNLHYDNVDSRAIVLNNEEFLNSTFEIDYFYFLSGNYTNSHNQLLEINFDLFRYIKKYPNTKFIYISSTNVYGTHSSDITENSSFNNPSLYAQFKLSGEFLVSSLKNYSIVRLTYLYGPRITNSSFLPAIIKQAKEKLIININGNGERYQDYLYIDDAVEIVFLTSKISENRIFLAASGTKTTNKEAASLISKFTGCKVNYIGDEQSPSYGFDPSKSLAILKWKPKIKFEIGLLKMLE
ncbi:MAG: nad-dependent epimerase/dehydratase [Chitinophagaceae bacterium]|nr:MAG: nad-dependent epimerase/dehydratase [Chitinophagaceae bacterium]